MRRAAALAAGVAGLLTCAPAAHALPGEITARSVAGSAAEAGAIRAAEPQLELESDRRSLGARILRYRQHVAGVPVLGSEAVLTDVPGQRRDLLLDSTRRRLEAPPAATVPRHRAIAVAERAVGVRRRWRKPRAAQAVLPAGGSDTRRVWVVEVSSLRPFAASQVLVDARTGEVVAERDRIARAQGSAKIFDTNPVTFYGTGEPPAGELRDTDDQGRLDMESAPLLAARVPVTLERLEEGAEERENAPYACAKGSYTLKGSYVMPYFSGQIADDGTLPAKLYEPLCTTDPARDFSALGRADDGFEALMAYYHVDRTQALLKQLGFTALKSHPQKVYANWTYAGPGSSYLPAYDEILLSFGGVDDGEDAEIIVHEYGHAIQHAQVPGLDVTGQAGAIGEGFADYLAGTTTRRMAAVSPTASLDACIAEWGVLTVDDPAAANPSCLRRLDTGLTSADVGPGTDCDAEVHCAGQAYSTVLWAVRERLGADVADRLAIQANYSLPTNATFRQGAQALLSADRALYGGVHDGFLRTAAAELGLDDQPDGSQALAVGGQGAGQVAIGADEHDLYSLPLVAGQRVVLSVSGTAPDTNLRLLRPGTATATQAGAALAASSAGGSNETLVFEAPATGTYLADVVGAAGRGRYTLRVQPAATPAGPPAAPPAAPKKPARASKVSLKRLRVRRGKVTLRAALSPAGVAAGAVQVELQRRSCRTARVRGKRRKVCRYRKAAVRPKVRRLGTGRVEITVTLRARGLYRIRATVTGGGRKVRSGWVAARR